jgi:dephospho-CoA kinase
MKTPATKKIVIGLTGGMGSGKSTVLAEFKRLGAVTADADALVGKFLAPGGEALGKVARLLGKDVLRSDGTLDRKAVAAKIFAAPILRKKLEALLHPLVRRDMAALIAGTRRGVVVLDVPLLFESKMEDLADRTLVVWAPRAARLARIQAAGRFTRADALARMKSQMPLAEKRRRADDVVDNGGSRAAARRQARALWAAWRAMC